MYNLLIVDDEQIEIEALQYILSNSNLGISSIQTALSGREAIEKATTFSPDFVLMDIKMPGISGIEAATTIKEMFPSCKIIFLTAYNYFDYAKQALELGATDFLIKPVENEALIKVLENLIHQKKEETKARDFQLSIEYKYKQISSFFEDELINYLLFSDCQKQQIYEYFNALNVTPAYMHTLIMSLDSSVLSKTSSLKETVLKKRLVKHIKKSFDPYNIQILGNYNTNFIYLLLNTEKPLTVDPIESKLVEISIYIKNNFQIANRIIISPSTLDVMMIKDFFIKYKYHLLTHRQSDILCFPNINLQQLASFSWDAEKKLLESILLMNESASLMFVNEYIDWLYRQPFTTQMLRYHIYGLLTFLIRSIQNNESRPNPALESLHIDLMESLQNLSSKSGYQSFLQEQILLFVHLLKQENTPTDHSAIQKICNYINQNYNQDITLPDLSKLVYLNSQYISKRFKEVKGLTFSQYLTQIRIEHAKKLLKETNLSINAISEQVGYNDPNYFTRAFKRSQFMTPKAYRSFAK